MPQLLPELTVRGYGPIALTLSRPFPLFHMFSSASPFFFQAGQPQRLGEPAAPPHQHLPRPHHRPLLPQLGRRINEFIKE